MVRGDSHHAEKIHDQKRALYRNRPTLSKSCHQTRYLDFEGSFHAFWRCFKRARASNSQAFGTPRRGHSATLRMTSYPLEARAAGQTLNCGKCSGVAVESVTPLIVRAAYSGGKSFGSISTSGGRA